MKFNTKMFAAAVSTAFVMASSSAYAGALTMDADGGGTPTVTFANEIFGTGSDVTVLPTVANSTATYTMASAPGAGAAFTIDYTLSNGATWGTALTAGSCTYVGAGATTVALVEGGAATDNTAKFRVDVTTAMAVGDSFALAFQVDTASALAAAGSAINMSVALTDTLGPVDTTQNSNFFLSADGSTGAAAASTTSTDIFIDVVDNSAEFAGLNAGDKVSDTEIIIGAISATDNGVFEDDAVTPWAAGAGDALNTTTITLTGDFSASLAVDADATPATADGLYIDFNGNGLYTAGEEATTLTGTTATWIIPNGAALLAANGNIHMVVDGTSAIVEQTPVVTMAIDWTDPTYVDESISANMRTLAKNGATDTVNFLLKPDSAFSNLIRISNTGSVAGDVFLTLINDAGASVNFKLDALDAYATATLASGASTAYISVADLYAAAQAADATFDNNGGQLRLNVSSTCTEILVNAFAMSKDYNVFTVIDSVDNATN